MIKSDSKLGYLNIFLLLNSFLIRWKIKCGSEPWGHYILQQSHQRAPIQWTEAICDSIPLGPSTSTWRRLWRFFKSSNSVSNDYNYLNKFKDNNFFTIFFIIYYDWYMIKMMSIIDRYTNNIFLIINYHLI